MKILSLMTLDMFRLTFGWALESNGHQVYYLNDISEEQLEHAIHTFRPDMIVTIGWDVLHTKTDILAEVMKRHRIFHLYFAEEDWFHFERWSKPYVSRMSPQFVLTRSANCISSYQKMGIKSKYLDVGCNPFFHRPMPPNPKYVCDVSVIVNGQFMWDIFRRKSIMNLVAPLLEAPFHTKIWGRDWHEMKDYLGVSPRNEMMQGSIPYHLTPQVYNSAKINISVQTVEDQISSRTYDILASGGFLLTSDSPGVSAKLSSESDCAVSNSPEETIKKIKYYLEHEDKRKKKAGNGLKYAREHASYQNTIAKVWPQIETEVKAFYG